LDYQAFLSEHAGLFLLNGVSTQVAISQLRLGADLVTDFVIGEDRGSYGFCYQLVELESPHVEPYTRSGNPSARLTQAIQQVQNWRRWLETNSQEAKRLFPSAEYTLYGNPCFSYTIFIGRRGTGQQHRTLRNQLSRDLGIQIRSFDSLSDAFKRRPLLDELVLASPEHDRLASELRQRLANPFVSAYSDAAWRRVVRSKTLSLAHMVAQNAETLVAEASYSSLAEAFNRLWGEVPEHQQKHYADAYAEHGRRARS
jgi:hypothetical protein